MQISFSNKIKKFFLFCLLTLIFPNISEAQEESYIDDRVSVKSLNFISIDEINFLSDNEIDKFSNLWKNSSSKYLTLWLRTLSGQKSLSISEYFKKIILLSSFKNIHYNKNNENLTNIRLKILSTSKDIKNIKNIIGKVPRNLITEDINKIYASALIVNNELQEACNKLAPNLSKEYNNFFWYKFLIPCYALIDRTPDARLILATLQEEDDYPKISDDELVIINGLISKNPIVKFHTKQNFINYIKETYLQIPKTDSHLPKIEINELKKSKISKLTLETKSKNSKEKLVDIINFYSSIENNGFEVSIDKWLQLFNFAITKDILIPQKIASVILNHANNNFSLGETLLIIVHIIDSYHSNIEEIPSDIIIETLRKLNLTEEAKAMNDELYSLVKSPPYSERNE